MPHSALSRTAASLVALVSAAALVGATLTAPTAVAADGGDRTSGATSSRAASNALSRAQDALAGKGGDATMALRDLWVQRNNLSPADRAAYAKLAARPVKPTFVDAGNVRVHYTPGGARPAATTRTSWPPTPRSSPTPTPAPATGCPSPTSARAASDQTDIYVDTLQQGLYGYCTTDNDVQQPGPGRFDVPAFCVVDNDYAGFPTNTPLENLQVTLAHEYFHATQFAYDAFDDGWAMEATAAWVEDEVFDGVDDNVQYLNDSPITDRKRSIDKFGGLFHYGVWIFFRYLTEKFPAETGGLPTIVLQVLGGRGQLQGRQEGPVLHPGDGRGPEEEALQAARSTRRSRCSPTPTAGRRLDYEEGKSNTANTYPIAKVNGKKGLNKGQAKTFNATLDHLSAATYQFTPKGNAKKLQVSISGPPKAQGTRAVVTTYLKSGKVKTKYVAINSNGKGSFKGSFKKSKVASRRGDAGQRQRPLRRLLREQHAVLLLGQAARREQAHLGLRQGGLTPTDDLHRTVHPGVRRVNSR